MKKLLPLFLALIMIAAAAVGCAGSTGTGDASSDVGTPSGSESDSGSGEDNGPIVPMPTYGNMTVINDEAIAELWAATEARINEILTTESSVTPAEGGTAWYVSEKSGKDSNDGLTPETPFKTLTALVRKAKQGKLKAGDAVYFERGGTYRNTADRQDQQFRAISGVKYSAYGEGAKPILTTSLGNAADPSYWKQLEGNSNVWYTSQYVDHIGVGNVTFNDGEAQGEAVRLEYYDEDPNGRAGDLYTGLPYTSPEDLSRERQFQYVLENGKGRIYVYSASGNPGEIYDSIYFGRHYPAIDCAQDTTDVVFDNLSFRYSGDAVLLGNCKNITVQNCELAYLGGAIQPGEDYTGETYRRWDVCSGNGATVYGSCDGFYIRNNYAHHIFEEAFSTQYNGAVPMRDVHYTDNVITYCRQAVSLWGASEVGTLEYVNNHCWYTGYDQPSEGHHWYGEDGGAIELRIKDIGDNVTFTMTGNITAFAGAMLAYLVPGRSNYTFGDNIYIGEDDCYIRIDGSPYAWNDSAAAAMKDIVLEKDAKLYVYLTEEYTSVRNDDSMTLPADVKVGDTVKFGVYEQDNVTENGAEEIEWIVLSVEDNKALLLSKYILDVTQYYPSEDFLYWNTSTIAEFLNREFINRAFTREEYGKLNEVTVGLDGNDKYDFYNTDEGCASKVFILSGQELIQYLGEDNLKASATEYAINREGYGMNIPIKDGSAAYWLRNYGKLWKFAGYINVDGEWDMYGSYWWVSCNKGVRPAVLVTIGE